MSQISSASLQNTPLPITVTRTQAHGASREKGSPSIVITYQAARGETPLSGAELRSAVELARRMWRAKEGGGHGDFQDLKMQSLPAPKDALHTTDVAYETRQGPLNEPRKDTLFLEEKDIRTYESFRHASPRSSEEDLQKRIDVYAQDKTALLAVLHDQKVQGKFSGDLGSQLDVALGYMEGLEKDMQTARALQAKMENGKPLSPKEAVRLNEILRGHKEKLTIVQGYLADQIDLAGKWSFDGFEPGVQRSLRENAQVSLRALSTRLAESHMEVADLLTAYEDQLPDRLPISREDRRHHNLLCAYAALHAAEHIKGSDPSVPMEGVIKTLRQHIDILEKGTSPAAMRQDLKGVMDMPLAKTKKDAKTAFAQHFAAGGGLPLPQEDIRYRDMLTAFVQSRLPKGRKDIDVKFLFDRGFVDAVNSKHSWAPLKHTVEFELGGRAHRYESTITPAVNFDTHLPASYAGRGVGCNDRLQGRHVSNLALSQLHDKNGTQISSILRHGVLDAYDMTPKNLSKLSDTQLGDLLQELLVDRGSEGTRESLLAAFRKSSTQAKQISAALREQASYKMAEEAAAAAIATDPALLQQALEGKEPVPLTLFSLSLLTPDYLRGLSGNSRKDELAMLRHQTRALKHLEQLPTLAMRDANGTPIQVPVKIRARTMNYGVNAGAVDSFKGIPSNTPIWRRLMGWGVAANINNPEMESLLGARADKSLGGEVAERLTQMDSQIRDLMVQISTQTIGHEDPALTDHLYGLVAAQQELRETAGQAKDLWRSGDFQVGASDPYKEVTRLERIGFLMGEKVLVNCKSGKDRTGEKDRDGKYTAAYSQIQGKPPPPDVRPTGESRRMNTAFALHTGNLEMQRLNTGLPGYKLKPMPALRDRLDALSRGTYIGGSDMVAA